MAAYERVIESWKMGVGEMNSTEGSSTPSVPPSTFNRSRALSDSFVRQQIIAQKNACNDEVRESFLTVWPCLA